jgi:hypothetical protein
MTGQGKAIVCAVGSHTLLASIRGQQEYKVKESVTHLEAKLDSTAKKIRQYAVVIMFASILT